LVRNIIAKIKNIPEITEQLPAFGGLIRELIESILYNCKNVGIVGWSFGPDICLIIPKNFCKKFNINNQINILGLFNRYL